MKRRVETTFYSNDKTRTSCKMYFYDEENIKTNLLEAISMMLYINGLILIHNYLIDSVKLALIVGDVKLRFFRLSKQ